MKPLHVAFTMDCERIAAESPPGGPETWELSERAIRGYAELLLNRGYRPTLFLTPECAQQHPALLTRLAAKGAELALHVHPQSLGDHRFQRYLGEYDAAQQAEIIDLAARMVERAIGRRPESFRPGNCSANDQTFGLLYSLGFRQGSVSDPGRRSPQYAAIWEGAVPDPHYVNVADKLAAGDLPFLEVPVTTDPTRHHASGFPYELRIESGAFHAWHEPIIARTLARMERERPQLPTLCIFTHNVFPYDVPTDPRRETVLDMTEYLGNLTEYQVIPVTIEEAHAHYRAHLAEHASS